MNTTEAVATGVSIPKGDAHACSGSLPRYSDMIAYEEHEEWILSILQSGYPRFFINLIVAEVKCSLLRLKQKKQDMTNNNSSVSNVVRN